MFRRMTMLLLVLVMGLFPALQPFTSNGLSKVYAVANEQNLDATRLANHTTSSGQDYKITLITGDVVTVTDIGNEKSIITVEPVNKMNNGFQVMTLGEDTFVIPTEAMSHIADDLLDRNLFNITQLIADGYDDENQATLPVIVQYHETNARFESALPTTLAGSKRTNVLKSIDAVAVSANKKQAEVFWEDLTDNAGESSEMTGGIKKIWLDGRVQMHLGESVYQIGAPQVWDSGYDGTGVNIAVLDTGVDVSHPDFEGLKIEIANFVPDEDEKDYSGHGTHVASTVLGTGAGSEGFNRGVAPGANLYTGKVLDSTGYGQESWIIRAMEWAAEKADIVNMSLGNSTPSDGTDPMSQTVNRLSKEKGTLFVIAAGNSGAEGIGSPGAADYALTIGNVDKEDRLAFTSSRGPRFKNDGLKPDLVAPGTDIVAARSSYSYQGDGLYISLSGTSMASPHVAGAAALLKQKHPDWNGEQLKAALMSSTKKIDSIKPYQGGSGRLDIEAATKRTVFASGSIDFGFFSWPQADMENVERTVTYTNIGDEPVTLDLTSTFLDNNGLAAPEGLLQLESDQITVPANGQVDVALSFNPTLAEVDQRYQGHLHAELNGEVVATSAMAVGIEGERHTLTIHATDTQGKDARAVVTLVGKDYYPQTFVLFGKTELRLEPDTYSILSMMDVDDETDQAGVAVLGNPEIILDGDKTVNLDARNVSEIIADIPEKSTPDFRKLELFRSFGGPNEIEFTYVLPATKSKMYAQTMDAVTEGTFDFNTRWRLSKPGLTVSKEGNDIETITLPGGTVFDGEFELPVVYAGNGAATDYEGLDVEDTAVLVKRTDNISGSERAAAAHQAGAKLLLIVNDEASKFSEWVGTDDYENMSPIAVASVSGEVGDVLIEEALAGAVTVTVEGTAISPYLYDLIDNHHHAIPADLTYAPTREELARIDARYYSDIPAKGAGFRWDIPTYRDNGIGFKVDLTFPSARTEWVSATEETIWYHEAQINDEFGYGLWGVRQPMALYSPGEHLKENWFSPVVRPYIGEGFWVPERFENDLQFNIPTGADGGIGNTGYTFGGPGDTLKLYKGDELLESDEGQTLFYNDAEEGLTEYRLVSDTARDVNRWRTSINTHTEWTILTEKQEEFHTFLPMISLDYIVDTDMNGNALGEDTITIGLQASQISYASGNGNIDGATLSVSFDEGKQWEKVELVRDGNGWIAEITNKGTKGTYVSLQVSAWDDLGNKIDQEIIKAFGISSSTPDPGPGPNPDPNPGPVDPTPDPGPVDPEPEKPEAPVFTDITNTFAKEEINKLAAKGIIQGKTETTFAPNAQISRGEFTVLLARALNLPMKEYEGKFKDVHTSKKWAYAGIEAAANAGIVNGTLDGKFNPDAPIKREEIAAMVVRAIEYKDKTKLDNLETPANFTDHGSIGAYAIDSVYKATALGVIKGNEGQFNPKYNATRAEAAVMLYRALDTLTLLD